MIIGEFKGIQPYVSAVIGITRLGVFGSGGFLVDTGASVTCLHPRDSIALRLSFDRLERREHIVGVGGRSERFSEQVTLTFLDSASAVTYVCNLDVRVGKPEQVGGGLPSVLGQDVLSRWLMVHDPTDRRLQFHVRSVDAISG